MTKMRMIYRILLYYLSFFFVKRWALFAFFIGGMYVPCHSTESETIHLEQKEGVEILHDGKEFMSVQDSLQKMQNIESERLEKIYEAYENEQHVKNIILYSGIFILLMAGVVIVILVYTLRMRAKTQHSMQEMELARQNFFTNITHEFRTPLTVILGIADGLKKRIADKSTEPGFDLIIRQGNDMLTLVNQLLYISNVRLVASYKDWRTGDFVAFMCMVVETARMQATKDLIDIELTTSESSIQMDFVPDYMQKLLQSLFSSVIKFTPRGGEIHVFVTLEKKVVNMVITSLEMKIAEKDLPHIFDPFYQGTTLNANLRTGIGLLLVRQMTEAMDGKIEVFNLEEKGTKFLISIPQNHADEEFKKWIPEEEKLQEEEIHSIPSDEKKVILESHEEVLSSEKESNSPIDEDMRQPTLLVIEDNADIARYIGAVLENRYRLIFARDGKEGQAKAEEYMPDLILTDLMMPEMDGYELCRVIRASNILNHIPIIMVTARCDEKDLLMGLEAGADAYLIKPFSADELKIRVTKLLEQRRLLREKYSKAMQEGKSDSVKISDADKEFMARLQKVLLVNISDTDLSSETLADKLFMSKSQLNRKVKSITGLDTSTYVRQSRMLFAKKLMTAEDLSIGDIVERCGFESPSYFTKTFKQYFGITPSQYRKRMEQ